MGRTLFCHRLAGDDGCGDKSNYNGQGTGLVRSNGIITRVSINAPDCIPPFNTIDLTHRFVGNGAANEEKTENGGDSANLPMSMWSLTACFGP